MSIHQRGQPVEHHARPLRRLGFAVALGAGSWVALSTPLLLGRVGYGELNLVRTTLLALAAGLLPLLQNRLHPEVEAEPGGVGLVTALWPAMSCWAGLAGTALILSGWLAIRMGARWASGWMGEDLGAIGATIIFLLVNGSTALGSLVLLIRDLKWAKRTPSETLLSLAHVTYCALGCWRFLR
jgi:hypothetical protein